MNKITRRAVLISLAIIYVAVLPIGLYFVYVFAQPANLKTKFYGMHEYSVEYDYSEREIFLLTGIKFSYFEELSFKHSKNETQIISLKYMPEKICYVEMVFTYNKNYPITLTVHMPQSPKELKHFENLPYRRIVLHDRVVGVCENKTADLYVARYMSDTGRLCYVESFLGFNDIENDFLYLLLSLEDF